MLKLLRITGFLLAPTLSTTVSAGVVVFSVGGDNTAASIQATVDNFRAALGDPNNGNAPGPLSDGRREINWDGGGNNANTAAGPTPFDVFLNTRGGQFTTPGTEFLQAPPSGGPTDGLAGFFANPTYATTFSTFSPLRLFTPVDSTITDAGFFIPGTNGLVPTTVTGFGAVFTDVDLADVSQLQFFGFGGGSLGSFNVPIGTVPDGSLSFLGVLFDAGERIERVRIITGNTPLGPNDDPAGGVDVVALDDFLYSEPAPVPEPASWVIFGAGALALAAMRRRRRATSL